MSGSPTADALPRVLADCKETRLASGLRVLVAETCAVPLVHFLWVAPAGGRHDPRGLEGLAALVLPLLRTGTRNHGGDWIAALADDRGVDVVTRLDWEAASLALELSEEDWELGFDLGRELLLAPVFPAAGLAALRRRHLSTLRRRLSDRAALAHDVLRRMAFGGSDLSHGLLGTPESVARVERGDLVDFHRSRFRLPSATLICVGSLRPEALFERLAALPAAAPVALREAGPGASEALEAPASGLRPSGSQSETWLLDVPGVAGVEIRLGFTLPARDQGELAEARLLTYVLRARLRGSLLQRRAASYRVRSRLSTRDGHGLLTLSAEVDATSAQRSVEAIHDEIEKLLQEGVESEELAVARSVLEVELWRRFQTLPGTARALGLLARSGSGSAAFRASLERCRGASGEDLRRLAGGFLARDRTSLVLAGSVGSVRSDLAGFVNLRELDPAELWLSDRPLRRSSG